MQHLKSLVKRPRIHVKLPSFTAKVVRWGGRAARLEASQGRSPDFSGASGAATKTDAPIGGKAFTSKLFSSRLRLPDQDSSRGIRPSTESEFAETHEYIILGFR